MAGNNVPLRRESDKSRRIPVFILFLLFYIPLFFVVSSLFNQENVSDRWILIKEIVSKPSFFRTIRFTLAQAFLSALLSVLLALPGAALFSKYRFKGKKAFISLSAISFILPPILVVLAFVQFWGQNGWVNQLLLFIKPDAVPLKILYSAKAIIMAHVFYNIPLALRYIYDAWRSIPHSQMEAASSLGATPAEQFRRIVLPQLLPAIFSVFLIIFLYCFLSFSIVLVLGGGPKFSTLEVEIYQQIKFTQNYATGGIFAIIEILISVTLLTCYLQLEKKRSHFAKQEISLQSGIQLDRSGRFILISYMTVFLLFLGAPIISIIAKSFYYTGGAWTNGKGSLSFHWFQSIFSIKNQNYLSIKALLNSFKYAFSSTLLVSVITSLTGHLLIKRKILFPHFTQFLILMPMGISTVVLSLGFLILSINMPDSNFLRGILIVFIHAFTALPFSYRALSDRIDRLPLNLIEAAESLGASPVKSFIHVEWPLLRPALLTGALFAFALSMGEVNAVLVLSRAEQITIPLAIYRLIGNYNFNGASAMGTLLIVITFLVFIFLEKLDNEY